MIKGKGTFDEPWESIFINLIDVDLVTHISEPGDFINVQIMTCDDGELHVLTFSESDAVELAQRILKLME